MWKDTIRKNIFEEDPEEMTDFMNVSPRMKNEAEKRKNDRSDDNIKLFETAMMNLKRAYNKVILDADKILRNAEKGEFSTFPVWLSNFEMFEEMVEGMKINMNRLTRMSDKEEEEMYRRMR